MTRAVKGNEDKKADDREKRLEGKRIFVEGFAELFVRGVTLIVDYNFARTEETRRRMHDFVWNARKLLGMSLHAMRDLSTVPIIRY